MALKQATIFKDFLISANQDNTAVKFTKVDGLSLSVKNDNFASQVEIYDADDSVDLFSYKYITFDNSAIFEITDCIKNENYTTLFIQYLSNITFDEYDENFRISGLSVRHLQNLGLDINELFQIFGNDLKIKRERYTHSDIKDHIYSQPFCFAVRLRLSELPQNLKWDFTGNGRRVAESYLVTHNTFKDSGSLFCNPADAGEIFSNNWDNYSSTDQFVNVTIPIPFSDIPNRVRFEEQVEPTPEKSFEITIHDFISTLNALLSDLVVSAEITVLNSKSLQLLAGLGYTYDINFEYGKYYNKTEHTQSDCFLQHIDLTKIFSIGDGKSGVMALDDFVKETVDGENPYHEMTDSVPIYVNISSKLIGGLAETLNYVPIMFKTQNDISKIHTSFYFLGNKINLSTMKNYQESGSALLGVFAKREIGSIRLYTDIERNVYTDIPTEFEYSQSAFSNYNAYKKSNIDLLNSQKTDSLQLLQTQQRKAQDFDTATGIANTVARSAFAFGTGGIASGIGTLVGGTASAVASEMKFNASQQNAIANEKMAQTHAHNTARATIVPQSVTNGSLRLSTAFVNKTDNEDDDERFVFFEVDTVKPNTYELVDTVFKKQIMKKTDSVIPPSQYRLFSWYPNIYPRKVYQAMISNRDPINNRKDFVIFCSI